MKKITQITLVKKLFILLFILFLGSCQNRLEFQAPSKELIDSVVLSAIKELKFNVFKYSEKEIDSLIKRGEWKTPFYLNSKLLGWNSNLDSDVLTRNLFKENYSFNLKYVNDRLRQQDSLILFDNIDSTFISDQIESSFSDTLHLKTEKRIQYINNRIIHQKQYIGQQITYCQFSKPLFNRSKTAAIVGLSIHDLLQSENDGGVYLIMSRRGKNWTFLTDIDWWGH